MVRKADFGLIILCLLIFISPAVSLAATETIFNDGFESGDVSAWSATAVPVGGRFNLTVNNTAAMAGSNGLEVSTTSGIVSPAYTQDDSPSAETNYHVSFMLNVNDFGFSTNSGQQPEHHILLARDASGNRVFDAALIQYGFGTIELEVHVLDNSDMIGTINSVELTPGPHTITIDWQAADTGLSNGVCRFTLDDSVLGSASIINNDADVIESVRFGALPEDVTSAAGSYYLDSFTSWREVPDQAVPTLTEWGKIILILFMTGTALLILRRNRSDIG